MNPFRRSFLKLLATGGALAVSVPPLARADRVRVLPDGGDATASLVMGRSPELGRALGELTLGRPQARVASRCCGSTRRAPRPRRRSRS
jgi:hypothetical protein